jgi:hypothetical protein
MAPASKTYAASGTSRPLKRARLESRSGIDPPQFVLPPNAQGLCTATGATRSIFMWDVVMLVLGFGLFAAGIGYAYVCERL